MTGEVNNGSEVGTGTGGDNGGADTAVSVTPETGAGGTKISDMPDLQNTGGDGNEFSGLLDDFDDSDNDNTGNVVPSVSGKPTDADSVDSTKPKVEAPKPQEVKPEDTKPVIETQVVDPNAAPKPVEGQQPPGAPEQESQLGAPANFIEQLNANREVFKTKLAEQFTLDEATITELETDASTAIPKIMADLYLKVMGGVYNILDRGLPNMIDAHSRSSVQRTAIQEKFYGKFPSLNKPEYQPAIGAAVRQAKQLFPNDTQDAIMDRVGRMVAAAYGLETQAPAQQPATRRKAVPFTPAIGSPGPVREQAPAEQNIWSEMSQAFETDFGE